MKRIRLRRRAREQVLAWLPVLVMAACALGTVWLVRNAPRLDAGSAAAAPRHEPDYRMQQFSVRRFDAAGVLLSELRGIHGVHYPDTNTLEVQAPRMFAYDEGGAITHGRAQRGVSNHDGSQVQLYTDARIWRDAVQGADGRTTPALQFEGDYLNALTERAQLSSDQPVRLSRGADWFEGDRFDYDDTTGVANLRGHVRGMIAASSS